MSGEGEYIKPVVRLTRMSVAYSDIGRGKRRRAEASRWTIYGIDADGIERDYVEHTTEAEHDAWRASDPLWAEAQGALIARLLADPATRDFVLQINIKAALDQGDTESALELARHLSPEAWARITEGTGNERGPGDGARSSHEADRQEEEGRDMTGPSEHATDSDRSGDQPVPKGRRRRKQGEAQPARPTPPPAEKSGDTAEKARKEIGFAAAPPRSDKVQESPARSAPEPARRHESVGEYVFTSFKELRQALKAAETFGFDYVLTRSTAVSVTERDDNGDIRETEADTIYALQLFRTALGGDESYDPPLAPHVAVLRPEDSLDGEEA